MSNNAARRPQEGEWQNDAFLFLVSILSDYMAVSHDGPKLPLCRCSYCSGQREARVINGPTWGL